MYNLAGVLETSHGYLCVVQPISECFKSAMEDVNIMKMFIHFVLRKIIENIKESGHHLSLSAILHKGDSFGDFLI